MNTEKNQDGSSTENGGGEGSGVAEIQIKAQELADLKAKAGKAEQLEADLGSTKRDFKKLSKQMEDLKKTFNGDEKETPQKSEQQSNEPDYAKLAYLKSNQVEHPDDQKVVMDEAARLKLPLTDVLNMEHIKTRLTAQANERKSKEAMPDGTGRQGNLNKGDLDYYLVHPDEVPPPEIHAQVVQKRMQKIENDNKFASVPFVG